MPKNLSDLRILLLQIRENQTVRQEELESFARFGGVSTDQIDIWNVFDAPEFSPKIIEGYNALFVGGASEASVSEPELYPFIECGKSLLLHCITNSFPVFASCFGFQLAVVALGGSLVKDTKDFEQGMCPLSLTTAAKTDPLFCDVPEDFYAVSFHQESALTLPKECELLAYTKKCMHAFRVPEKPFWAFQFHPELDKQTLIERLSVYRDNYLEGPDHFDRVVARFVETPESNQLVKKFLERVVLKGAY